MTQESEYAAKGKLLEDFGNTRKHLDLLNSEMKKMARQLETLAQLLEKPNAYRVNIDADTITLAEFNAPPDRPKAIIKSTIWQSVVDVLRDYQKTSALKEELGKNLKPYIGE